MGSAADNVGNGSAALSGSGSPPLVTDGSSVTDGKILPSSAAQGSAGDETRTASTGSAAGQETIESPPDGQDDSSISGIWGLLICTGIGAFIALNNRTSRTFIFHWWWAILLPTVVVGALLAISPGRKSCPFRGPRVGPRVECVTRRVARVLETWLVRACSGIVLETGRLGVAGNVFTCYFARLGRTSDPSWMLR